MSFTYPLRLFFDCSTAHLSAPARMPSTSCSTPTQP